MATKLEALTKDLPPNVRLLLREALDQTNIKNPNDPIYELMLVLGLWAKYYQSIPDSVQQVAEEAGRSFDGRLTRFHQLAQLIQTAIDKLEATPKALETLFPSESVARNIAGKVDAHFRALPLLQLETDLKRVEQSLNHLLGKKGEPGLAVRVENSIGRLEETVKEVKKLDPTRTPWWKYAVCILGGAIITSFIMWLDVGLAVGRVSTDLQRSAAELRDLDVRLIATQEGVENLCQRIESISAADTEKIIHVLRNQESAVLAIDEFNIENIVSRNGVKYIYLGTPPKKSKR